MIYPDNFEHKTGFDEIRQMLSDRCICPLGVQLVDEMQFMTDFQPIEKVEPTPQKKPAKPVKQCRALTWEGKQCPRKPEEGKRYCKQHCK